MYSVGIMSKMTSSKIFAKKSRHDWASIICAIIKCTIICKQRIWLRTGFMLKPIKKLRPRKVETAPLEKFDNFVASSTMLSAYFSMIIRGNFFSNTLSGGTRYQSFFLTKKEEFQTTILRVFGSCRTETSIGDLKSSFRLRCVLLNSRGFQLKSTISGFWPSTGSTMISRFCLKRPFMNNSLSWSFVMLSGTRKGSEN